jgi:hypothetical protein
VCGWFIPSTHCADGSSSWLPTRKPGERIGSTSVTTQDGFRRRDGRQRGQRLSPKPLAQRREPPSFRIREPYALPTELPPEEPILGPQVLDLILQAADEPYRQPRCQELWRKRKRHARHSAGQRRAKIRGFHESPRHGNRGEPLDTTMVRADPLFAQDPTAETTMAMLRVTEHSRKRRPTIPPMSKQGPDTRN